VRARQPTNQASKQLMLNVQFVSHYGVLHCVDWDEYRHYFDKMKKETLQTLIPIVTIV